MTNPQKAKGSGAERAVVEFLRANGFPHAERRLAGSSKDRGDIAGVPAVVIEVKNCERTNLAAWLAEAALEQANDRADYGVVWHKRRGRSDAGQWYATLPAAQLVQLLRAAGYGQPLSAPASTESQDPAPFEGESTPNGLAASERPTSAAAFATTGGI
jgi:hypothetical protein